MGIDYDKYLKKSSPESPLTPDTTSPLESKDDSAGFADYAADIGKGVVNGVAGFAESAANLGILGVNAGIGVTNMLGADNDYVDYQSGWGVGENDTWVGSLVDGITQFSIGFAISGGLLNSAAKGSSLMSWAARKEGYQGLNIARTMTQGAMADFMSFSGQEERLSNLIETAPQLRNDVTKYLAADDDDSEIEGRFKNVIEGLGLGVATDILLPALRGMKRSRKEINLAYKAIAEADGDPALIKKILEATNGRLHGIAEEERPLIEAAVAAWKQEKADIASGFKPKITKKGTAVGEAVIDSDTATVERVVSTKKQPHGLTAEEMDSFIDKYSTAVERGADAQEVMDEFVHYNTFNTADPEQMAALTKTLSEQFAERLGRNPQTDVQTWKTVKDMAARYAMEPEDLELIFKADAKEAPFWAGRMYAGNVMLEIHMKEAYKLAQIDSLVGHSAETRDAVGMALTRLLGFGHDFFEVQAGHARATNIGRLSNKEFSWGKMKEMFDSLGADLKDDKMDGIIRHLLATKGDPDKMAKAITQTMSTKFWNAHNEGFINGLLSSAKSFTVDQLGNIFNTIIMPAERFVGGMLVGNKAVMDEAAGTYVGLRRFFTGFLELFDSAKSIPDGSMTRNPYKRAMEVLSGRTDERAILEQGHTQYKEFAPKAISAEAVGATGLLGDLIDGGGKFIRMPTRLRTTADEMFASLNFEAAAASKFTQIGKRGGMSGTQLAEFVTDNTNKLFNKDGSANLAHPFTNELLEYSREARWTQELEYGFSKDVVEAGIRKHPALRAIIPFVRVPTNIIRGVWARTPGLQYLQKQWRENLMSANPMRAAKARGQQAMGAALYGTAVMLANEGLITGSGPTDIKQRKALEMTGWQGNSVRIGKGADAKYFAYNRLDPVGLILGLASDFADIAAEADDDESENLASAMIVSLSGNLTNKTYMMGLTEALNAITRQEQAPIRRRLGAYVPSVITQTGQAFGLEEHQRDIVSWMDAIKARIPGLSNTLPPRRNIFGEQIRTTKGWNMNNLSPFAYSEGIDDDVKAELAEVRHGFTLPRKEQLGVDMHQFKSKSGQTAYDRWLELTGKEKIDGKTLHSALDKLVKGQGYQRLKKSDTEESKAQRVNEISRIIQWYRGKAMQRVEREFPEVRNARKAVLREKRLARMLGK